MMKPDPLFSGYAPEVLGVHGTIGSGKSFLSLTISQFWPADLAARAKSGGKKIVLEDLFAFEVDSNPYAGCSTLGIEVPGLSLQKLRGDPKEWAKYGFSRRPSVLEAAGLYAKLLTERCAKGQTHFGLIDTVSGLDGAFLAHNNVVVAGDPQLASNKYAVWQLNLASHQKFHDAVKFAGALAVIYDMHTRAVDEATDSAKKKNVSVLVAGGSKFVPAVTGQSAGVYKRDMTMQFVCRVKRVPGKKGAEAIARTVITDVDDEAGEIKQRYSGVLPQEMKPDLRAAYKLIRAAQKRWT